MNATFSHNNSGLAARYSLAAGGDVALRCWPLPFLIVGEC
jgi:hypothetical protein